MLTPFMQIEDVNTLRDVLGASYVLLRDLAEAQGAAIDDEAFCYRNDPVIRRIKALKELLRREGSLT